MSCAYIGQLYYQELIKEQPPYEHNTTIKVESFLTKYTLQAENLPTAWSRTLIEGDS